MSKIFKKNILNVVAIILIVCTFTLFAVSSTDDEEPNESGSRIDDFESSTNSDELTDGGVKTENTSGEEKNDESSVELSEDSVNTEYVENTSDENSNTSAENIRPEFKEAMDAYEAFYDEYCDFMKKYAENPYDITLLAKYGEMLTKAEEMNEAFEKWEEDELSNAELKYYLDVNNRVMQKLLEISG